MPGCVRDREMEGSRRGHLRIEIDTPVGELAEGSLLLELGSLLGVLQTEKQLSVFPSDLVQLKRIALP